MNDDHDDFDEADALIQQWLMKRGLSREAATSLRETGPKVRACFAEVARTRGIEPPSIVALMRLVEFVQWHQHCTRSAANDPDRKLAADLFQASARARDLIPELCEALRPIIAYHQQVADIVAGADAIPAEVTAELKRRDEIIWPSVRQTHLQSVWSRLAAEHSQAPSSDRRSRREEMAAVLADLLDLLNVIQREELIGPPKSANRPAPWLIPARILAPMVKDAWDAADVPSAYTTATGPRIAVLVKLLFLLTGQNVEPETLCTNLRRHPPLEERRDLTGNTGNFLH